MLHDKVRCESYKNAIEAIVKGKTVLDVGAGTGFLSVIAVKAGAIHVYAVEYSKMSDYAKQFINDNGCASNITLIKRRMEDVSILDVPKVDVIISEWMGYFLLFENMLPSVIDARERFLKEDGFMLPCEGRIYIAGVEWIGTEMNGVIMQPDKKSFNEAQVMLCN
jgi:type I protein arginine methyltransferase